MNPNRKKAYERRVVEAFVRSREYELAVIEDVTRERPDALLRIDGQLIGVEVTSSIYAEPRHETEPQRWTIEATRAVSSAEVRFKSRNPDALVVRFEFCPEWSPRRDERDEIADRLASFVEDTIRTTQIPRERPLTLKHPLPDVTWAYIGRTSASLGGVWAPSFAFSVQSASAQDIIATVCSKEKDLPTYLHAAPIAWLLITCDVTGQGLAMEVPDPSFTIETGFARVFCCGFGFWQWVEIPTRHS
jgi:hypothetical protein